jgi:hypothetical protein
VYQGFQEFLVGLDCLQVQFLLQHHLFQASLLLPADQAVLLLQVIRLLQVLQMHQDFQVCLLVQ